MFALAIVFYFCLCALAGALLLLPDFRTGLWQQLSITGTRASNVAKKLALASGKSTSTMAQQSRDQAAATLHALKRRRVLLLATLTLLMSGPMTAYLFREKIQLEGFGDTESQAVNAQVATLLQGERLTPPAPLPPEVFVATEVELLRPMLASADRKWDLMDPEFVQRTLRLFKLMREQYGYEMALLEGYRSPERQNLLAAMGGNVTNARAFQSWHQYGLAADCAFLRNGKLIISEKDPWAMRGYQLYGQLAVSMGLVWGGNWRMMDLGHVELRRKGTLKR